VIDVPVRRLRPDAHLPQQAYEGDAGLDLSACEALTIEPGQRAVVPTGVAVEIPEGYAGFVQPRSGLASRHGIGIVNAPGLIDSGYRGEVRVLLLNTDRACPFQVDPGDRIAQLLVTRIAAAEPVAAVDLVELTASTPAATGEGPARGEGGFGSSGR